MEIQTSTLKPECVLRQPVVEYMTFDRKMKTHFVIFGLVLSGLAFANEDHLVMIPTPIHDQNDGGEIHIVKRPMISGYGANFEGYCGRISAPYIGDVSSPSTNVKEMDLNPASIAGIKLVAVLPRAERSYIVTIDYSKAKESSLKDVRLLRAIMSCVYMFGDYLHGNLKLKANFEIIGIDENSVLHSALSKCIEERAQQIQKVERGGDARRE